MPTIRQDVSSKNDFLETKLGLLASAPLHTQGTEIGFCALVWQPQPTGMTDFFFRTSHRFSFLFWLGKTWVSNPHNQKKKPKIRSKDLQFERKGLATLQYFPRHSYTHISKSCNLGWCCKACVHHCIDSGFFKPASQRHATALLVTTRGEYAIDRGQ